MLFDLCIRLYVVIFIKRMAADNTTERTSLPNRSSHWRRYWWAFILPGVSVSHHGFSPPNDQAQRRGRSAKESSSRLIRVRCSALLGDGSHVPSTNISYTPSTRIISVSHVS